MEEGNSLKSQIASVCPIYVVTFNDESRSMWRINIIVEAATAASDQCLPTVA
jgi:hypothetical protein